MKSPGKIITLDAAAEVAAHRIVALTGDDYEAAEAAAATDALIGISTETGAPAAGRLDVIIDGVAAVEYGGTVEGGDAITANANGQAVAAGAAENAVGRALVGGSAGDIGSVIISLFTTAAE